MRLSVRIVLGVTAVVTTAKLAFAQPLSLQIVTPTGIVVTANQAQNSVPPLTDLTAGLSLQVNDPFTQSTASVQITPTSTPNQGQVRFDATLVASRAVSITFARILQHTVAMTWTSPQPAFGRLRIEMCRTPNFPLFDIKATPVGYGSTTLPFEWPSCTPPFVREYLVRVDQAGLVVQLDASGTAFGGFMSSTMLGSSR